MVRLLTALILAFWICTIALLAAQNGTRVSLQFLGMQTIAIPLGIMLAFCAAIGVIGAALLLPLLRLGSTPLGRSLSDREDFER